MDDNTPKLIPLDEFRKMLGKTAETLSEEEILKLRDQQDRLAEILFAKWLKTLKIVKYE